MFTFRQISSIVWTFMGFMLAAAVVLNMRYKPLDETSLLDTWTGRIQRVAAESPVPAAKERVAIAESRRNGVDILLLEELTEQQVRVHQHDGRCAAIRFAYPAPGSRFPSR